MSRSLTPACRRTPRRTGVPHYLYRVTFEDGSEGWYWPDTTGADRLFRDKDFRDDYEITIVWWHA